MTELADKRMVPPTACPYCGAVHDAVSAVGEEPCTPEQGDVAICIECAEPSVFDGGRRRKPTEDELEEMDEIEGFEDAVRGVRLTIEKRRSVM